MRIHIGDERRYGRPQDCVCTNCPRMPLATATSAIFGPFIFESNAPSERHHGWTIGLGRCSKKYIWKISKPAPARRKLLRCWRNIARFAKATSFPIHAFSPVCLPEHASNLAVVQPIGDRDYLYIYYGRTIFQTSGVEMMGSKVSQWKSEVGSFFCEAYDLRQPSCALCTRCTVRIMDTRAFVGTAYPAGPRNRRQPAAGRVQSAAQVPR